MNLAVFFESVDVVKHEKRLRCEDTNMCSFFPVDYEKPWELVRIPVEPIHDTWLEQFCRQNSQYIPGQRCFGKYQIMLREDEAMHVAKATGRPNGTKDFTAI